MAFESDLEDDGTLRQIALSNQIAWYCIIDLYIYCRNLQNLVELCRTVQNLAEICVKKGGGLKKLPILRSCGEITHQMG